MKAYAKSAAFIVAVMIGVTVLNRSITIPVLGTYLPK